MLQAADLTWCCGTATGWQHVSSEPGPLPIRGEASPLHGTSGQSSFSLLLLHPTRSAAITHPVQSFTPAMRTELLRCILSAGLLVLLQRDAVNLGHVLDVYLEACGVRAVDHIG